MADMTSTSPRSRSAAAMPTSRDARRFRRGLMRIVVPVASAIIVLVTIALVVAVFGDAVFGHNPGL